MSYIKTSTANPLGWRPLNSRIPTAPPGMNRGFNIAPANMPIFANGAPAANAGPTGNHLGGYFPAQFAVPTPGEITSMVPVANVLGDYFPNYPSLVPTRIATRDNRFSPVPRIYRPPEMIPLPNLSGLGADAGDAYAARLNRAGAELVAALRAKGAIPARHSNLVASSKNKKAAGDDFWRRIAMRRQFSGGIHIPDATNPAGVFFPTLAAQPSQFPAPNAQNVWSPDAGDPQGYYYPRQATRVPLPAKYRVQPNRNWTQLGALGVSIARAPVPRPPGVPAEPISSPVIVGPARIHAPITTSTTSSQNWGVNAVQRDIRRTRENQRRQYSRRGRGEQQNQQYSRQNQYGGRGGQQNQPTYPAGTIPLGNGQCQYTSSPETGGVVSVVACDTLPGYSAGGMRGLGALGARNTMLPARSSVVRTQTSRPRQQHQILPGYSAAGYPISSPTSFRNSVTPYGGGTYGAQYGNQYGGRYGGSSGSRGQNSAFGQAMQAAQAGTLSASQLSSLSPQQQQAVLSAYQSALTGGGTAGTAYSTAMAAAENGTLTSAMLTSLTPAQQQQVISAYQGSAAAQQSALTESQGGGGGVVSDGTQQPAQAQAAPSDGGGYQSVLDWLSEQTLITGFPNWGVVAVAGFGALWIMNRGKR